MLIVAITDIHGSGRISKKLDNDLAAADAVIVAGDLTTFGTRRDAERVLSPILKRASRVLAVPGNCDPGAVSDYLTEKDVNLHGDVRVLGGITFLGLGGSLPCPGSTPNEYTEEELAALLRRASRNLADSTPLVVVSHQPPRDTCNDCIGRDEHVGSRAVRTFLERTIPRVCVTGHIHEGMGIDHIGPTCIVNPGPLRQGGYARIDIEADGDSTVEIRKAE